MTLGALLTTVSDAPSCGVTHNSHSDDSRGVIDNHNIFIIQATQQVKQFQWESLKQKARVLVRFKTFSTQSNICNARPGTYPLNGAT
jgi:hypothetical protein